MLAGPRRGPGAPGRRDLPATARRFADARGSCTPFRRKYHAG